MANISNANPPLRFTEIAEWFRGQRLIDWIRLALDIWRAMATNRHI